MSTVSVELVLGLCILGTCVMTVVSYAVSRLLRPKVLNRHEESAEAANPFHRMSREQKDYMAEVRKRNSKDAWERLQVDAVKERKRQGQNTTRVRGSCRRKKGRDAFQIRLRCDHSSVVYGEIHPSASGPGRAAGYGSAYGSAGGNYEDVDPAFETLQPRSRSAFLKVPHHNGQRPMNKASGRSLMVGDRKKQNGAFSTRFESIAGGG